ncbi:MAG: TldD/PmbA family protein [Defluviitaleaceae bacterium]|nr:TldD/PmbA family protein [Defluviitaleaceae bacterium]
MNDIANYALEALKKAGADKAAVCANKDRKDEFNVQENKFTLLRTQFNDQLTLKALVGGRKGVTVINKHDKTSVDEAVADCIALAKLGMTDEAEDIAPMEHNQKFDQTIGGYDMDGLFNRTKEYVEQVNNEFPKIMLESVTSEFTTEKWQYVNSNGAAFSNEEEYYSFSNMFMGKDGEKTTSFNHYGGPLADLKTAFMDFGLQRQLLAESVKSLDTRTIEGKFVGKIIVAPTCEDMIWHTLLHYFLGEQVLIEGTSRWKDALETLVANPMLTMRSIPLNPAIIAGERITEDGFLSRDNDFIKDGILKSFALGLYGANKTGKPRAANTAHYNLEVAGGDTSFEAMIKSVDRGILINRFSGAEPGTSGDVSGIAKNSFLIENGKITDALQETMISFNITDVIKNISGISQERICDGQSILPWCCFDGVTVSGK